MSLTTAIQTLSLASAIGYALQVGQPPILAYLRFSPRLLTAALSLGSLGDAFLAWDSDAAFIRGLASFLSAHLLYIRLFSLYHGSLYVSAYFVLSSGDWRTAAAGVLTALIVCMITLLMPRVGADLQIPVFVYSLVIYTMAVTALSLESQRVLIGALLFTTSDAILAADRFLVASKSAHRGWMQHAIWTLYYSGQLLVSLGF